MVTSLFEGDIYKRQGLHKIKNNNYTEAVRIFTFGNE
uniref:Uncharacterized protein n=1 Tax=Anguilla anguilla TaxID=7936 RepID=A0A0E9WPF8_ANGAN